MAFTIPNLDRIQKADPKLGEALAKLQNYSNLNVTPAAGNRSPNPPFNPTQVRG
jgi:hypothetical protein